MDNFNKKHPFGCFLKKKLKLFFNDLDMRSATVTVLKRHGPPNFGTTFQTFIIRITVIPNKSK